MKSVDSFQQYLHHQSSYYSSVANDYDYCLVFPTHNGSFTPKKGMGYMTILQNLGFEMYCFSVDLDDTLLVDYLRPAAMLKSITSMLLSPLDKCKKKNQIDNPYDSNKMIFVLLKTPVEKLREYAERYQLRLQLDSQLIDEILKAGDEEIGIQPATIRHEPEVSSILPYDYIYTSYKRKCEHLFIKPHELSIKDYKYTIKSRGTSFSLASTKSLFMTAVYSGWGRNPTEGKVFPEDDNVELGSSSKLNSPSPTYSPSKKLAWHEQESILAKKEEETKHPFRELIRLQLAAIILESRPRTTIDGKPVSYTPLFSPAVLLTLQDINSSHCVRNIVILFSFSREKLRGLCLLPFSFSFSVYRRIFNI